MTAWVPTVRYIANGEAVDQTNTNRPLSDLAARTQHLKEIIDQATAGEVLVKREAVLFAGTAVGDMVYFDSTTLQHKGAISEVLINISGPYTGPRSLTVGMVVSMTSPTVGTIVTGGLFRDTGGILTALLPGAYYLSDSVVSGLTQTLPPVPIFIGIKNADNTFQFSIDTKDLVNSSDSVYQFAVTSVATANTNLIVTGCEDGQPVPPGPLDPRTKNVVVKLEDFVVTDDAPDGGQVFKVTNGAVGFKRGWVAEKLLAGPGITLSSTHTIVNVNPLLTTYQGEVTVTATSALNSASIQVVSLDNSREELTRGVLHHSFPRSIASSMRLKVVIPGTGAKTLSIKLWIMGSVVGSLPDIGAAFHELLDPGVIVSGPVVAGDTALTDITLLPIISAYQYFLVSVPNIVCTGGSIVHIELSRAGDTDGYVGEVGVLNMRADIS